MCVPTYIFGQSYYYGMYSDMLTFCIALLRVQMF